VTLTTEAPLAEERFRALRSVVDVTRDATRFTIQGRGDGFITEVIQCLAEHQMRVDSFRTGQPTLEDVFLKLTGHSIRD
jgi:ABC-2 type transport system ATP-binding protein